MKRIIKLFLITTALSISVSSSLFAGEEMPILNGIQPFVGVFIAGEDEPIVSFSNKDGFAMFGVNLIDNISPMWGFEMAVAFVPDKSDSFFVLYHGNLIANLRVRGPVYPYLTFGIGAITVADPGDSETNLALNYGVGLKRRVSSSIHLSVDYRDFAHFVEDEVQHIQQLVFGVGYSFNSVFFE